MKIFLLKELLLQELISGRNNRVQFQVDDPRICRYHEPVMLLGIVYKAHFRLEIFSPTLISEFPDVTASLPRLTSVPGTNNFRPHSECPEATFTRNQGRILVSKQSADECSTRVRIFGRPRSGGESLSIVPTHTSVTYTGARGENELKAGVTIRDLVVGQVVLRLSAVVERGILDLIDSVAVLFDVLPLVFGGIAIVCFVFSLWLMGVRVRCRKIVIVGKFQPIVLGVVRDLAMTLVDHVFSRGFERSETFAFAVAINADVPDHDLFAEVGDEAGDVDEVFRVGDEEGVDGGHMRQVVFEGGGGLGAE